MDDHFSWSDSFRAVFGSCFHCFPSPQEDPQDVENPSHHQSSAPGARLGLSLSRQDELEGLLADSDDAETLSLHSNIGDRNRRRKKKRRPRKGIRLFGFDLFGRPPVYLSEDEDGAGESRRRGGQRRVGGILSEQFEGEEDPERVRTLSTSTLDSDAAPLDPSTIDELSAAQLAASLAREEEERKAREEERKAKEERRRKRRERKELKKAAMAFAMNNHGDGEFEGFPGSGPTYGHISSPFHNADTESLTVSSTSPLPHEDFGDFEEGQLAHDRMFEDFDDADDHGADFGAATYTKRATGNSNGSGSDSRSRTSASGSNADPTRYNHHYLSQPPPTRSRSNTVDYSYMQPPFVLPKETTNQHHKKKKSKSGRSSRHSVSSTSQSTSLASPPPHQGNLQFNPAPMLVSDENGVIQAFPQELTPISGFPSVGLPGAMRRKNSEAGVFLARRGDD